MVYKTVFIISFLLLNCLLISAIVSEEDAVTKPPKRWENLPWPIPMSRDEYSRHASGVNVSRLWLPPDRDVATGTIEKEKPQPGETEDTKPEERKSNWEIIPDPNSEGGFRLIKKPPPGSVSTIEGLSNIVNTENGKGNFGSSYVLSTGLSSADNIKKPSTDVLGHGVQSGSGTSEGNNHQQHPVDKLGSGLSSGSSVNSGVSIATDLWKPSADKLGSNVSSAGVIVTGVYPGSAIKTPSRNVLGTGVDSGNTGNIVPSQQETTTVHIPVIYTENKNGGSWNHGVPDSANIGQSSSIGYGVAINGQQFQVKPVTQWEIGPANSGQNHGSQWDAGQSSSSNQHFMPAYHWNNVGAVIVPATVSQQSPLVGNAVQNTASPISSFDMVKCPPGATGQFVYRPDCRRYLNCWKGRGFTQVCAPGTLFNPETLECDFPSKVKCLPMTADEQNWNNIQVNNTVERHFVREGRVLKVTEAPTTVAPPVQPRKTDCPMEGGTGLAPHPTDCRKFFNCWKGTAHTMQCGPGTLFNPNTLLCDFPYNVNCIVTTSNTPAPGKFSPNKPNQQDHQLEPVKPITQTPKPPATTTIKTTTTIRTTPRLTRATTTIKTTPKYVPPPTVPTTVPTTTVPPATTMKITPKPVVVEKKKRNPSGQVLRLRGGPGPWEGYVEVQGPEGGWGLVCDDRNSWKISEANVVCRQLGYERGAELSWQGRPLRPTEDTLRVTVNKVACGGNEAFFSACDLTRGQECVIARDAIAVRCYKNWVSQCQPGEMNHDRKCYKLIVPSVRHALEGFSHGEALRDCRQRDSQLLDITSQEENDFISEWLIQLEPNISNILTSGVGVSVPERSLWVWEGSISPFRFTKWWPGWTNELANAPSTGDRPICIVAKRVFPCEHAYYISEDIKDIDTHSHENLNVRMCAANYFYWYTEDCSITHSHPYICERPVDDIGCLEADRQSYKGTANVTASGLPCIKWDDTSVVTKLKYRISERERLANFIGHNYCRSVGTDTQPWCYAGKKKTREPCDIPSCWSKALEKTVIVEGCRPEHFDCQTGECIPRTWRCDGEKDCRNGRDELNCGGLFEEFNKNASYRLQGHDIEKWLKTDAKTCAKHCKEAKDFVCRSFSHHVRDSVCLLSDSNVGLSGGLVPHAEWDYYEMKSRTVVCNDRFQCDNGKCLNASKVCNGKNDCGDKSDEKMCTAEYLGYEIRLAGSNISNEGRVEVKAFGRWGLICDDLFGLRDAEVICRDLGYSLGAAEVLPPGTYISRDPNDDKIFLVDDLKCIGNESSLLECEFEGWGIHDCLPEEAVSVVCSVPGMTCAANYWQCETSKECLPIAYLCDNIEDCDDGSDENRKRCNAPVELRLAGGSSNMEGRVEVRYHGIWGTVCDDDFATPAATVICRSLGFNGPAQAKKDGAFGPGEGQIWLDQLHCSGNESDIKQCVHARWGEHNCQHSEDAGVICSTAESRQSMNTDEQGEWSQETNSIPVSKILPSQCGTRNLDRLNELDSFRARVVGGNEVLKGSYPWQASVRVRTGDKSVHWCGAVIISPLHVLTAGHCLQDYTKGAYLIRVGDHDTEEREGTEQELNIDEYYLHEEFNVGKRLNHDIAVVKLKGLGIQLGSDIMPACLPRHGMQFTPGLNCTISGWGSMKAAGSGYSRRLRAAWIPLLSHETCRAGFVYGSDAIGEGMFCAGNLEGGVDSCQGDSGGPIICLINGEFTLYGITSWGHGCGRPNKPGVYSNVGYYREWIDHKLQDSMSGR